MGACNDEVVASAEEELFQGFRKRNVGETTVQDGFQFWIPSGDGVANYDEVCVSREILGGVTFGECDPFVFQKGAHGRVNVIIGACDGVTLGGHSGGYGPHGRAADANEMNVAEGGLHKKRGG